MTYVRIAGKTHIGREKHRRIADIATRQHGVVSHAQLRAVGFSGSAIDREVATGRLHPVFRGVFAVGHAQIDRYGRLHAALLACGGGTVSHNSAATLLGIQERYPNLIDVIAPNQSGRQIDGIRRHFVTPPRRDELTTRDGISCTNPSRTLVDLAGVSGERSLRRAVRQAAVLRILDVHEIDSILARGRRRGAPRLRAILEGWRAASAKTPKLRSHLEALLYPMLAEHDLPTPLTNHKLRVAGRTLEVDFFWPDRHLVVEADSHAFHGNPEAFELDRLRDRDLNLAGYRVLRVTWAQLDQQPTATLAAIRHMLT